MIADEPLATAARMSGIMLSTGKLSMNGEYPIRLTDASAIGYCFDGKSLKAIIDKDPELLDSSRFIDNLIPERH